MVTPPVNAMAAATQPVASTSKVPLFEASTQFRNWRFSFDGLAELRASMNAVAVDAIRSKIEANEAGSSNDISFLTPDEEVLLVKLYLTKVPQLCGMFRFPEEIEATAVSYIKRFYLRNTVMDYHPKNVMLTALFLATKTANFPISLEVYTKHIPKTAPSDVLDLEFLVAQSLAFEFTVWHAHRALWGIWLDVQTLPDATADLKPDLYNSALGHIRASRLTDAEFVYTPSQIAIAAFSMVAPDLARRWFESKHSQEHNVCWAVIEDVRSMIGTQGKPPNIESVRVVDRRLKLCINPEKVPGSKAFLAKQAEEERRAEEKRNKKAQGQKGIDDPFGGAPIDDDDDD